VQKLKKNETIMSVKLYKNTEIKQHAKQ